MPHPTNLYDVHLELARQRDCPGGDSGHGYDLITPLTRDGHLDIALWRANPTACRVRRFRPGEPDLIGHLERRPGGRWYFDYGPETIDEEPGFRFGDEQFALGQYVSIREAEGRFHDFRITAVRSLKRRTGPPDPIPSP